MEETILAQRIKKIRMDKGLTLEGLAQRTGFTKGLLSKIENNKVSPPVSTLAKIARALEVSLGDFFSAMDSATQIKIVRKAERPVYRPENHPGGQLIETLMSGFQNQRLEPMIISIEDPQNFKPRTFNHPGQEFILILAGAMHYHYDGMIYELGEGDAVYFNAGNLHGPVPLAGGKVTYLSIICP